MSSFGDQTETDIINYFFRNQAVTQPTSFTVALYTAAPSDAGGGTEVGAGIGYSRQAITFGAPSGGATSNSGVITFGPATSNWGTVTHFAIFDNGSVFRAWAPLTASKTVNSGDSASFAAGALTLTVT